MSPRAPQWRHPPKVITLLIFGSGLWLTISPYVLAIAWHGPAFWNATVVGVSLLAMGLLRFGYPRLFERLRPALLILGSWMIASPYVVNYSDVAAATANAIIVGALVIFATLAATARPATRPT